MWAMEDTGGEGPYGPDVAFAAIRDHCVSRLAGTCRDGQGRGGVGGSTYNNQPKNGSNSGSDSSQNPFNLEGVDFNVDSSCKVILNLLK